MAADFFVVPTVTYRLLFVLVLLAQVSAFSSTEHEITVRDGHVTEVWATTEAGVRWKRLPPAEGDRYTIPGLFAMAQSLRHQTDTDRIEVTYDRTYPFPRTIGVYRSGVTDGWSRTHVRQFDVLR